MSFKDKISNSPNIIKVIKIILSFIVPVLIIIFKPFDMDLNQSMVLGILILVLIWWITGIVNRLFASTFLLLGFSIIRLDELNLIFRFPLSVNFYLIIFSFVLSQGIVNSNVASRLGDFIFGRYGNNYIKLTIIAFILGAVLIFMIPQSFARVILLFALFEEFFKDKDIPKESKEVMMFLVAVATTCTIMLFSNGDIVLNYASMDFGNTIISWMDWAKYMFIPTIFSSIVTGIVFVRVFKKELVEIKIPSKNIDNCDKIKLNNTEIKTITIMTFVLLFWMTERFHHINGAIVAIVGVLIMFVFKIINIKDFRSLNLELMTFITAAYSIGSVMKSSGVADIIYSRIVKLFPSNFSNLYIFVLIISVMVVHFILGSSLTTISIMIPVMVQMTEGLVNSVFIVLIIYIVANMHYLFPIHQLTVLIGSGKNYFPNNIVLKFGLALTPLVIFIIFAFYIPWWKFTGLI